MRQPWLLLALLSASLLGCAKTVSYEELLREPHVRSLANDEILYMGSKDGFDYFWVGATGFGWPMDRSDTFRVAQAQTGVSNRFPLTRDRARWKSGVGRQEPIEIKGEISMDAAGNAFVKAWEDP